MMRSATSFFLLLTILGLQIAAARPSRPLAAERQAAGSTRYGLRPLLAVLPAQGTAPTLSVYPNPARGQTTVQVSGSSGPDYQVRLSNVLGSEVRRLAVRPDGQPTEGLTLDLSALPPGLYFCSLLANEKTLATKRLTVL